MLRTAKSCGPDAPTLASSLRRHVGSTGLRQPISADDGGKRARSPGRARNKLLKPLRAGMPGDPGATVVTTLVCHQHFAHEAAGAAGTRHFPRPQRGERFLHSSGASRREIVKWYLELERDGFELKPRTYVHQSSRRNGFVVIPAQRLCRCRWRCERSEPRRMSSRAVALRDGRVAASSG